MFYRYVPKTNSTSFFFTQHPTLLTMTKFTTEDFLAASHDAPHQEPATPERTLTVSITPLNLRLPVAPPSPPYPGLNQDINTEPFPDYIESPSFGAGPNHCSADCSHTVCRSLSLHDVAPACHCGSDTSDAPLSRSPTPSTSILVVNAVSLELAREAHQGTAGDDFLTVYLEDAESLLSQLHLYLYTETRLIDELALNLYEHLGPVAADVAMGLTDFFITNMGLYVVRTLHAMESRELTLEQLCLELHVYLWTMLRDYAAAYAEEHPDEEVEDIGPESFSEIDPESAPGLVGFFWQGCAHDFVALLVLHSMMTAEEGDESDESDEDEEDEENEYEAADEEGDEELEVDEDEEALVEMALQAETDAQVDELLFELQ
jgi:hypothetical protein